MKEVMAGLKINFNRSKMIMINDDNIWEVCPIKYLGFQSVHIDSTSENPLMIDKSNKRLDICGTMSIVG
jgi:hypothetical protein